MKHLFTIVRNQEKAEISPTVATQGDTFKNNEAFFAAAHAVDGDLSTLAITNTDNGAGWIRLKFDKTYIHKVVIYWRVYIKWYKSSNYCAESESNFKDCLDNENNVDVSVYQGDVKQKSCGTLQLTYGLEQSDQIYTLVCNTEGDAIKLSKDSDTGSQIVVSEVAITSTGLQSAAHYLTLNYELKNNLLILLKYLCT